MSFPGPIKTRGRDRDEGVTLATKPHVVHLGRMGSENLLSRLKSSPAARRVAMVLLLAGLGAVAWLSMSHAPVESTVAVDLSGPWPALDSVTLTYCEAESVEPLRQVKLFPAQGARGVVDHPVLARGAYRLEVTVETRGGTIVQERILDHAAGDEHRIELVHEGR